MREAQECHLIGEHQKLEGTGSTPELLTKLMCHHHLPGFNQLSVTIVYTCAKYVFPVDHVDDCPWWVLEGQLLP